MTRTRKSAISWFIWAGCIHIFIALATYNMPEPGDLQVYKYWAITAFDQGLHQAYINTSVHYDQLPLYWYVCYGVGGLYDLSGLQDLFGPYSSALSFLFRAVMIGFHIGTGVMVYALCLTIGQKERQARLASMLFLLHPGLIIATDLYGYPDAFHTCLLMGATLCLLQKNHFGVWVLCGLVLLTKPQAAIYLLPVVCYGLCAFGWLWVIKGFGVGLGSCLIVLSPFIMLGQFNGVVEMYLNVTQIHKWLTGYAHNFWWLLSPVPPFTSDRVPIIFGVSGLEIGLVLLGFFALWVCWHLMEQATPALFLETCALFGFGFFMMVTEIHENHPYAMFAFLAPLAVQKNSWRWVYVILCVTFALNLILAHLWMENAVLAQFGVFRLDTFNTLVNVGVFLFWCYQFFAPKGELNT